MSSQRTNSVELNTILAAESSAPSLAASIPPELFNDILAYVRDEAQLYSVDIFDTTSPHNASAMAARRDGMRHLSACASTCVYWAQLTRGHMFRRLVLRSSEAMSGLLSLLHAPQSPRIPPICDILRYISVYYRLGDHPWFHNLAGLWARYQVPHLNEIELHIIGPATPVFVAASTRGSILHPLSFGTPRVLPIVFPKHCSVFLYIRSIRLPNPTMLSNLLQDCLSLWPLCISCTNLTWDVDPVLQATPSSIGLKYACYTSHGYWNEVSGCTDNVLVAAMLESVSHHEFSLRRRDPYLDPLETSYLFDAMRITWCGLSPERQRTERFEISSNSDPDSIQEDAAMRLPAGIDFCLMWEVNHFIFRCIASRLPHAPATSNNVRIITHIIIKLQWFDNHLELRRYMKTANVDWNTFLQTVRQFSHFRQVVIQRGGYPDSDSFPRQILVEFLAHLGGAWFALDELLGLYYKGWRESRYEWVQLQLDTLMDEIEQRRAEIRAEADAEKAASESNETESNVVAEGSESSAHTGNE